MDKTIWLARLLYQRGPLTRKEIAEAWCDMDSKGHPLPKSTFYDNCNYLESRYGMRIVQANRRYSLEIPYNDQRLMRLLLEDPTETEDVETKVKGAQWFPLLEEAISEGNLLRMTYAPLDKAAYDTDFAPYCLRQFRKNGYCVGFSSRHQEVRNFALDRVEALTVLPQHYHIPGDFCADEYFRHSFGVFGGKDAQPEHIVLETDERTAAYLRSRPLHTSQHETRLVDAVRIELDVAPTKDFISELLSFGPSLVVVQPEHLRKEIRQKIKKAAEAYSEEY